MLNDLSITRLGGENRAVSCTTPDVMMIDGRCNADSVEWWAEDMGQVASDHVAIYTLISEIYTALSETARDSWIIRTGNKQDWKGFVSDVEARLVEWYEQFGKELGDAVDAVITKKMRMMSMP